MSSVFDAYVIVDWSAAAVPKTGADSIWVGTVERRRDGGRSETLSNPATRVVAMADVTDLVLRLTEAGRRVLLGFDFAFGYPAGFAERLSPGAPDWQGVWSEIAARIADGPDNANNRFRAAADLNAEIAGTAFPFWGCPAKATAPTLTTTRPSGFEAELSEYRLTDRQARGTQSVWKLAYAGSVGSQSLLGIAHLQNLRQDPRLRDVTRIWPLETGLVSPLPDSNDGWQVLVAETWPSIVPHQRLVDEPRDAAQVRTLARHFAALDERGELAALFAGPPDLSDEQRTIVEREEAWILGIERVGVPAESEPYCRDPDEIYRRSFAVVRSETELDELPPDLAKVAERLIHACGMPDLLSDLAWSEGVAEAGRRALADGAPIFTDAHMVAAGIIRSRLPKGNEILCTLDAPGVAEAAKCGATTRSAAAVDLWGSELGGAVVAIGNAPTALFRLLERIAEGAPKPACILGFPVGFIGAAESKEALIARPAGVPYITVRGRRGGSAMASAAVNALAGLST